MNMLEMNEMTIGQIAQLIRKDWKKPNFAAIPYLNAMRYLDDLNDAYGYDRGDSLVRYFLANASSWRGDIARSIKAELNKRLKN